MWPNQPVVSNCPTDAMLKCNNFNIPYGELTDFIYLFTDTYMAP